MKPADENEVVARVLLEIAEALNEGAAGPCDYWYRVLALRLVERAKQRLGSAGSDARRT